MMTNDFLLQYVCVYPSQLTHSLKFNETNVPAHRATKMRGEKKRAINYNVRTLARRNTPHPCQNTITHLSCYHWDVLMVSRPKGALTPIIQLEAGYNSLYICCQFEERGLRAFTKLCAFLINLRDCSEST